jgi:hypothetical protein
LEAGAVAKNLAYFRLWILTILPPPHQPRFGLFALATGVLIPLLFAPVDNGATSFAAYCGLTSGRFVRYARWALKPEARSFGVLLNFVDILSSIFWSVKHYF